MEKIRPPAAFYPHPKPSKTKLDRVIMLIFSVTMALSTRTFPSDWKVLRFACFGISLLSAASAIDLDICCLKKIAQLKKWFNFGGDDCNLEKGFSSSRLPKYYRTSQVDRGKKDMLEHARSRTHGSSPASGGVGRKGRFEEKDNFREKSFDRTSQVDRGEKDMLEHAGSRTHGSSPASSGVGTTGRFEEKDD